MVPIFSCYKILRLVEQATAFKSSFVVEEVKVTPLSRRDMLLAMQTLRKGLLFRNADQWSLLCKLDDAVEQATKHEVKQSKIEQLFCAAEAEEQQIVNMFNMYCTVNFLCCFTHCARS